MGGAARHGGIGSAIVAVATVAVAFAAFREGARFLPLPPNIAKLILWSAIPLAVLLVQLRGGLRATLHGIGFRAFSLRQILPGIAGLMAAGGTLLAYGAKLPPGFDIGALALSAVVAPFAEELLFRGYLVNRLVAAGTGNLPAVIVGGLLFGLAHLGNVLHAAPATMLMEIGITAAGGMLFGWTLLRFEGALWAAFAFHAGLNLPWDAFGVDTTAIGGEAGNIARATGIVAGVVATIALTRRLRSAA